MENSPLWALVHKTNRTEKYPFIATNNWIVFAVRRSVNYCFPPNSPLFRTIGGEKKKKSGNCEAFCFWSKRKYVTRTHHSSGDALLLFQPKILAAINYIRNVNKPRPDTETTCKYIPRTEASNVKKTDMVNSTDELVKQSVVVNNNKKSGYNSFFYTTVV